MRIAILTGPFFGIPPAPCGAVERVWRDLAIEFVAKGHEVTVYTRAHESYRGDSYPFTLVQIPGFSSTSNLRVNLIKDLVYTSKALLAIKKCDILVSNTFWLPVLKSLRRVAHQYHVHVQRVPKGQYRLYMKFPQDRFAAVSSAIKMFIDDESPKAGALTEVFANPIDTNVFYLRKEKQELGKSIQVVYTGRIHPEKGLVNLARAIRHLNKRGDHQYHLNLIGPWKVEDGGGGEKLVAALKSQLSDAELTLHDPIYDREQLAETISRFDLYVYPSVATKGEASPVAPLEAMGLGMPVLVSNLPQFMDYLKEGKSGFVFDHEGRGAAKNLAKALHSIVTMDSDHRWSVQKKAAATGQTFSNSAVADRYLEDFNRLLERSRGKT